jgi:hypothetical protein
MDLASTHTNDLKEFSFLPKKFKKYNMIFFSQGQKYKFREYESTAGGRGGWGGGVKFS